MAYKDSKERMELMQCSKSSSQNSSNFASTRLYEQKIQHNYYDRWLSFTRRHSSHIYHWFILSGNWIYSSVIPFKNSHLFLSAPRFLPCKLQPAVFSDFKKKSMDFCNNFDEFSDNCFGFQEVSKVGPSLALDGKRGELVKALVKPAREVNGAGKALLALRNHSEAERRRRERINGHLTTLRGLIPGTAKMDKAALLAEVINQVKELRDHVTEVTRGTLVPTDIDELKVEQEGKNDENSFSIRASLCCDFKTELLCDIREAIEALPLKTIRAEIATLGSRMVNVFVIAGCKADEEGSQFLVDSVRKALRTVLDKFYASEEFSSRNTVSGKRRRVSLFSSSNSSSYRNVW